jgi:hypothetical protein
MPLGASRYIGIDRCNEGTQPHQIAPGAHIKIKTESQKKFNRSKILSISGISFHHQIEKIIFSELF